MLTGSVLAIAKKYTEYAVAMLASVIVLQAFVYGMIFDTNFFFRNVSVMGGLLMLLADGLTSKRKNLFAGLPTLNETDKSMYIQLTGRILLVFLFLASVMNGEFSFIRVLVSIIGLIGCVMVVVGFKAKYSAWMMIAFLSVSNVILNNWWSLHQYLLLI
jgi:ER-derived vesicles protein